MPSKRLLPMISTGLVCGLVWLGCGGSTGPSPEPPTISPAQQALFQATIGAPPPTPQSFEVRIPNSVNGRVSLGGIDYPVGQPAGWVVASLSSPVTPAVLSLQVSHASLGAGTYSATVRIKGRDDLETPLSVVLTVAPAPTSPLIGLAPASLNFTGSAGGANPASQTVQVTNAGTGTLSGLGLGTISYGAGATGWLTASLGAATAPATLTVQPNIAGLAQGMYSAIVPVTSTVAGNSPQPIQVTLTVAQAPTIVLSSSAVGFTDTLGGALPAAMAVTITNGGSGTLPLALGAISYGAGATGWLSGSLSANSAPATLSLQVLAALAPGQYTATQPILGTGAANSPQTLTVTLTVVAPDLVPTALSGPASATSGQVVTVSITEANAGNVGVGAGWPAEIRLSQDQSCSSSAVDPAALAYAGPAIAAGNSASGGRTVTVPSTLPAGIWYWCAILDAGGGTVQESNESNNTIIGNQVAVQSLLYADDFSAGLGNWVVHDPDGLASWTIVNGTILGDYNIGCGSSNCNQTQLLLVDSLQPGNIDWRLEVHALLETAYSGLMIQAGKFALYLSDSEKESIESGYSWPGSSAPATADSVYASHQAFPWQGVGYVVQAVSSWSTAAPQLVVLEKRGNVYTLFFNGVQVYAVTRTFSAAPKVGFSTYGGVRMDNFKLYALP